MNGVDWRKSLVWSVLSSDRAFELRQKLAVRVSAVMVNSVRCEQQKSRRLSGREAARVARSIC
jgi:hypothetical protein